MKKLARILALTSLILVFAFMPLIVVHAAPSFTIAFQEPAPISLDDLLATLKNLGGVALLIAALANAFKKFGWITDGQAPNASLAMNAIALIGLVALQITGKADSVPGIDVNAGFLATALNAILALVFQLYVSRKGHESVLAGMPLIGKSFSGRRAEEDSALEVFSEDRQV